MSWRSRPPVPGPFRERLHVKQPPCDDTGDIVGAAIGAVFFRERFGASRIVAAGLIVVGIGLMLRAG